MTEIAFTESEERQGRAQQEVVEAHRVVEQGAAHGRFTCRVGA